jgi:hypothetical protein
MYDDLSRMNDDQLSCQLIEAYTRVSKPYPESDMVRKLKGELYRRGHHRDEIVTMAVAALIRQNMN